MKLTATLITGLLLSAPAFAGEKDANVPLPANTLEFSQQDKEKESRWAFETGIAWITPNEIDDLYRFRDASIENNQNGGQIYYLTASYFLGELPFEAFGHEFRPRMELPLMLSMFDESSRSPFLDYNAAFSIRWVDFPWNHIIKTSFMTGVGPSYSDKIPLMDHQRHPDEDRSHLKFNWPIQLTLALPSQPEHQLTLFIDHQSGGHVFDQGGINSVGIGYRYQPE